MSARDEMMKTLVDFTSFPGGVADEVLQTLASAGYRILGPDEDDSVTLENAAEIADTFEDWGDYSGYLETASSQIASRVRALGRKA